MSNFPDTTRQRILSTAGEVFAERGFRAATIREICLQARTNIASVNYHFGDKRRLYVACLEEAQRERDALFPQPEIDRTASLRQQLFTLVRGILQRLIQAEPSSWQGRLLFRELLEPSEAVHPIFNLSVRPMFESMVRMVSGLAHDRLEHREKLYLTYSIVSQCLFYRMAGPLVDFLTPELPADPKHSLDDVAEHIVASVMAWICVRFPDIELERLEAGSSITPIAS